MWPLTSTTATTATYVRWINLTTASTTTTGVYFYQNNANVWWPNRVAQPVYAAPRPAIIRARRTPEEIAEAAARARQLLIGELNSEQRAQFDRDGSFLVIGRHGRYRIRRAVAGNIDVLGRLRGQIKHRLCCHPIDTDMPREDVMLAQLIHLRHDEDGFLRTANRHEAPGINPATDRHLAWAEVRLAA